MFNALKSASSETTKRVLHLLLGLSITLTLMGAWPTLVLHCLVRVPVPVAMAEEGEDSGDWGSLYDGDVDLELPSRLADQQRYGRSPDQQQFNPQPSAESATQAAKPAKRKWYQRIFDKGKKQASLPMNLTPKYPEGPKKDPPASANPLLRLQYPFVFKGRTVYPGFYLLTVEAVSSDRADLVLLQQDEPVVKIPARPINAFVYHPADTRSQQVGSDTDPSYFKPDEQQQETINEHQKASKPSESRKAPTHQPPIIRVSISEDQNYLMFVYTDPAHQYESIPLPIDPRY